MAEQWIEASRAVDLAGSNYALCERLSAGLVDSRARVLLIGDVRQEDAIIPPKFWRANGNEALEQNWASGDFSTWIDRSVEWKAFGATFALSGLLDMLAPEIRGVMARSLSVAGNADWVTASFARKFAYNEGGLNPASAGSVIIEKAKLGFITARAVLAEGNNHGNLGAERRLEACEWDVPQWFWTRFTIDGSSSQSWETGKFAGRGRADNGLRSITLTDVHFLKESLTALLPAGKAGTSSPVTVKNKGGRPPAAFADDLMCAIWGLIYQGDLVPKNQAEIARAMLDWAVANGHELGATVAREKAQRVFAALKTDIGNPSK